MTKEQITKVTIIKNRIREDSKKLRKECLMYLFKSDLTLLLDYLDSLHRERDKLQHKLDKMEHRVRGILNW
jgi:hypothetical protein